MTYTQDLLQVCMSTCLAMYNEIVTVTKYCLPLKREIVCVFVCVCQVGTESTLHDMQSPSPGHSSAADEA